MQWRLPRVKFGSLITARRFLHVNVAIAILVIRNGNTHYPRTFPPNHAFSILCCAIDRERLQLRLCLIPRPATDKLTGITWFTSCATSSAKIYIYSKRDWQTNQTKDDTTESRLGIWMKLTFYLIFLLLFNPS